MIRRPPRSTLFPYTRSSDLYSHAANRLPIHDPRGPRQLPHGGGWRHRRSDRRSEEHTSELQSHSDLVCRLLLEKKKKKNREIDVDEIYPRDDTVSVWQDRAC